MNHLKKDQRNKFYVDPDGKLRILDDAPASWFFGFEPEEWDLKQIFGVGVWVKKK